MRDALTGKVAIVTGASRGLGRAAAEALVAEGALVLAAARSTADLEKLRAEYPEQVATAIPLGTDALESVECLRRV